MKNFIITATLLLSVSAPMLAGACDNQSDPNTCGEIFNRVQAYEMIKSAENSNDDALADLKLIQDAAIGPTSLRASTYSFIKILNKLGNNATSDAQKSFTAISSTTYNLGANIEQVTDLYLRISNSENSNDDSLAGIKLIGESSANRYDLDSLGEIYLKLLIKLGSNDTSHVQLAFKEIMNGKSVTNLFPEILGDSFLRIVAAENSLDDAIADFKLVVSSFAICNDLNAATNEFIQILNENGNNDTANAQKTFRAIYGI